MASEILTPPAPRPRPHPAPRPPPAPRQHGQGLRPKMWVRRGTARKRRNQFFSSSLDIMRVNAPAPPPPIAPPSLRHLAVAPPRHFPPATVALVGHCGVQKFIDGARRHIILLAGYPGTGGVRLNVVHPRDARELLRHWRGSAPLVVRWSPSRRGAHGHFAALAGFCDPRWRESRRTRGEEGGGRSEERARKQCSTDVGLFMCRVLVFTAWWP